MRVDGLACQAEIRESLGEKIGIFEQAETREREIFLGAFVFFLLVGFPAVGEELDIKRFRRVERGATGQEEEKGASGG